MFENKLKNLLGSVNLCHITISHFLKLVMVDSSLLQSTAYVELSKVPNQISRIAAFVDNHWEMQPDLCNKFEVDAGGQTDKSGGRMCIICANVQGITPRTSGIVLIQFGLFSITNNRIV